LGGMLEGQLLEILMRYDLDNVILRVVDSFLLSVFMGVLEIYQMDI
jgi:hypothetical protein